MATRLEIFFGTNRNPIPEDAPTGFGGKFRPVPRFGRAVVSKRGKTWRIEEIRVDPRPMAEAFAEATNRIAMAGGGRNAFERAMADADGHGGLARYAARAVAAESDALVYIHGAGFSFEEAILATADLAELYRWNGRSLVPLVFSHPSGGEFSPIGYLLDRRDVAMSGLAMAAAFRRLTEFLHGLRVGRHLTGRVNLVAHSLGCFALRMAVQAIDDEQAVPRRAFDAAVLTAADDDADTLSVAQKARPLIQLSRSISVYHNRGDVLLQLSDLIHRTPLGLIGPPDVDHADYGGCDVQAVDCAAIGGADDPYGHRYYRATAAAVADIVEVLKGTPPDRVPGRERLGLRSYRISGRAPG